MFRPVSTALEIQGFLHAHIDISLILTRQSVGIIEIYLREFFVNTAVCSGLSRRNSRKQFCLELQRLFIFIHLLDDVIGTSKCSSVNEVSKMQNLMIYELVNAEMREAIDLTVKRDVIAESIFRVFPEAFGVMVFHSFYSYRLPFFAVKERHGRVKVLGRILARATAVVTQPAMRSYESKNHARSNQLFKAVKGVKRLEYCLATLKGAGLY